MVCDACPKFCEGISCCKSNSLCTIVSQIRGKEPPAGDQHDFPLECVGRKSRRINEWVYVMMIPITIRMLSGSLREDIVKTHLEQFCFLLEVTVSQWAKNVGT